MRVRVCLDIAIRIQKAKQNHILHEFTDNHNFLAYTVLLNMLGILI